MKIPMTSQDDVILWDHHHIQGLLWAETLFCTSWLESLKHIFTWQKIIIFALKHQPLGTRESVIYQAPGQTVYYWSWDFIKPCPQFPSPKLSSGVKLPRTQLKAVGAKQTRVFISFYLSFRLLILCFYFNNNNFNTKSSSFIKIFLYSR